MPHKITPVHFDVSIRPVKALVTTDGVQYLAAVSNQTTTYKDLFSINTDTDYPLVIGKLAYVYVNISLSAYSGSNDPAITYKLEAKNKNLTTWTIMSAQEEWTPTGDDVANHQLERIEGFLLLTAALVDTAPLSIRLQFKSAAETANDIVYMRLKNDTVIQLVGTYRAI
jgi:uncharacterized membrane protein